MSNRRLSLVEQAAKRLEELRKTGAQVSGELSYASHKDPMGKRNPEPSTIERAVERLGSLDQQASVSEGARVSVPREKPTRLTDEDLFPAGPNRREPRLGERLDDEPWARSDHSPPSTTGLRQPIRTVEIDLAWLSAAGYLTPDKAESDIANEFRKIKRPLVNAFQNKDGTSVKNANRIMVTSSLAGEGKSFVALNLAISIAMERDCTVLLIDADTTHSSLSQLLGLGSAPGLLDLLTDRFLPVSNAIVKTNIDRLAFLASGTQRPHATELLASEVMEGVVQQLASRYADRILLFDAPPLLAAAEPAVLAGYMGQIVVVVEANRTTHKALQHALAAVESCPAVMTVLNKALGTEQTYQYAG